MASTFISSAITWPTVDGPREVVVNWSDAHGKAQRFTFAEETTLKGLSEAAAQSLPREVYRRVACALERWEEHSLG